MKTLMLLILLLASPALADGIPSIPRVGEREVTTPVYGGNGEFLGYDRDYGTHRVWQPVQPIPPRRPRVEPVAPRIEPSERRRPRTR